MARKDSENQKKSMSKLFRGRAIIDMETGGALPSSPQSSPL